MATISSLGIGSGLDLNSLLTDLETAERQKLTPIETQQASYEAELSAWGTIQSRLESLDTAAAALADADTYAGMTTTASGSGVSATATSEVSAGSYSVAVTQLAQAQSLATTGQASRDEAIGDGTATTLTLSLGTLASDGSYAADAERSASIVIDESNNTLEGIRDAINEAGLGVTASIVNDGSDTPYRLVMTSDETGNEAVMSLSTSGEVAELDSLLSHDPASYDPTGSGMEEVVAARNAEFSVNGIGMQATSNVIDDAVDGLTLTLSETNTTASVVTVKENAESVSKAMETFVNAYNDLQDTIDNYTAFNADEGTAGELLGDSTLRTIESRLTSALNFTSEGDFYALSSLGVSRTNDGKLEFDSAVIEAADSEQLAAMSGFFISDDEAGTSGFASQMSSLLEEVVGEDGTLESTTEGIEGSLESLASQYEQTEDTIEATIERYREQFTELDILVANLTSTSDYLTSQLETLENSWDMTG
ncbi:MAG: flagellar filament capping protein FliD [Cobetia sp.]|uniref:flagellar filament capping protein FliD n=1 Tax=Cobetia sp. TaxID=1873876 RepID=UPI000C50598E|nr:flagellar filament capping protein FliD [Cobetia sp.]MBF09185.1 flagellar filament capping protein FliD [Cobetia sp.]MBK10867.1 flagellar filament capping protein FliD [Cobetia sp.]HBJ29019.1 flagellar filament capping protein FliD [Cobetia sp.]|tara:strand:+ start:543 stop:1985 length:1443 start_codon:yes stop_codon:yes gene_type:complete